MRAIVLETKGSMSINKTNMGFVRERLSFRTHWTGENRIHALIGIWVLLHPMSWRYLCNETLTIRDKKQSAFCVHVIFWHAGKREAGWFAPQLSCYSVFRHTPNFRYKSNNKDNPPDSLLILMIFRLWELWLTNWCYSQIKSNLRKLQHLSIEENYYLGMNSKVHRTKLDWWNFQWISVQTT